MTDTNDPMERAYEVLGVALGANAPCGLVPRAVRAAEVIAELRLNAKFAAVSFVESADTLIDRWIVDRVIDTESQGRDVLRSHLEARDTAVRAKALQWTADDKALPEDDQIKAAHPLRSGSHALYAEAMRMVGAKRSKGALVELVNWLLTREDKALAHIAALEGGIVAENRRVQKVLASTELAVEQLEQQVHDLRGDLAATELLTAEYDQDRTVLRAEREEWAQAIRSVAFGAVTSPQAAKGAIQELFDKAKLAEAKRESGCPCTLVEPCSCHCSCANPGLSGGCKRCCSHGSLEQRTAKAKRLAHAEAGAEAAERVVETARRIAFVAEFIERHPGLFRVWQPDDRIVDLKHDAGDAACDCPRDAVVRVEDFRALLAALRAYDALKTSAGSGDGTAPTSAHASAPVTPPEPAGDSCEHPRASWYADREYGTTFCGECHADITEWARRAVASPADSTAKGERCSACRGSGIVGGPNIANEYVTEQCHECRGGGVMEEEAGTVSKGGK